MNKTPLISIIVPVYNVAAYLRRCVDSILSSSYNEFELILIDDGSTDGSENICDSYLDIDKRIIVKHQENSGVSSARNEGLKIAKGEYIAFVDSDDEIDSNMFDILMRNAQQSNCDISCCRLDVIEPNGTIKLINSEESKLLSSEDVIMKYFDDPAIKEFFYGPVNKLFKRSAVDGVWFSNNRLGEDILFVFEVLQKSNLVYLDKYVGYHYIHRDDSAMRSSFSLKRLDYVYACQEVVKICKSNAPYALQAANIWLYRHTLVTLRQIFINKLQDNTEFTDFVKTNIEYLHDNKLLLKMLSFKRRLDYYILMYIPTFFQLYNRPYRK